jgi:predicted nucleotidyltransferase component of viral defense system
MKDYLFELIDPSRPQGSNRMIVREYLQEYFLNILYMKKLYRDLVFCGGTALRFLHKLKRFSEDIDFSTSVTSETVDFEYFLKELKQEFEAAAYSVEVTYDTRKNVKSAFFKFPGLLHEIGLSGHEDEKISIKFEVDTNPPEGGAEKTTMINRTFMFYVQHYTLESLFAGKIHAAVCRPFTKGRDWYDLIWYATKFPGIQPNVEMLNNALRQTDPDIEPVHEHTWKKLILSSLETADIEKAKDDVRGFLEIPEEAELISEDAICGLFDE